MLKPARGAPPGPVGGRWTAIFTLNQNYRVKSRTTTAIITVNDTAAVLAIDFFQLSASQKCTPSNLTKAERATE